MSAIKQALTKLLLSHRYLILVVIMTIFSAGIIASPTSLKNKQPKVYVPKTVIIKPAAKPQPVAAKPPPPAPPAPVAEAPPAPKVVHTSVPQPTSAPSPGKGVSSLAPTPSSSPSGSSGSSTGSGSSTSSPPPSTTNYTSENWSGYLINSGSLSTISASWIAPTPTGNGSSTSADATWIGIGGVSSSDLIQVGTENTVSPSGTVSTGAFYEMLPAVAQNISGLTVNPGDSITASITESSSNQWSITITDNTDKETFTTSVSYNSSNSSAEWIEEDPSYSTGGLVPLDDFHTVSFSDCLTTDNGVSANIDSLGADSVTMVNSQNQPIAVPSSLSNNAFSVSWQSPG